jgi:hypothetical protein
MPTQSTVTPEALDALIAASLQSRREALLRSARRQRIATRVAFGLSGLIALGVPAALLAGDDNAAVLVASIALITFIVTFVVWKNGRNRTADSLRKMDRPGR